MIVIDFCYEKKSNKKRPEQALSSCLTLVDSLLIAMVGHACLMRLNEEQIDYVIMACPAFCRSWLLFPGLVDKKDHLFVSGDLMSVIDI